VGWQINAARLAIAHFPGTIMNVVWFFQMIKGLVNVLKGKGDSDGDVQDKNGTNGGTNGVSTKSPYDKKRQ
jgi:hypothetical protein